ncbi:lytic transglycosylase [Streptomyces rimosus]|uniref:lytic transglycosylase domain-containing protein n=1 Tax=Streptomyces rimosus TaxID=1927 RepID=UPI0004C5B238|nr:lytic transglycosylase [Streptomyces rimosus]
MAATFGRRLRKGAASTAVAALALAALTASQAPGAAETRTGSETKDPASAGDTPIDGGSPYYTDLPPLNSPVPPGGSHGSGGPVVTGPAEAGIPATVLDAYKKAEAGVAQTQPGCRLPWQLLAAIGKVESGHARGGAVDAEGTTLQRITGPQLNGKGFAMIADTDHGVFDGDTTHDRAVGPMQFIPSTWSKGGPDGKGWGADGNGDGLKDPNNIYDAALGAGRYLCANGRDLGTQGDLDKAVLGYNPSREYLNTVLSWLAFYRNGTHEVPDGKGLLPVHRSPVGSGKGVGPTPGAGHTPGRTTGPGAGRSGSTTPKPGGNGSGKPGGSKPTTPPSTPGPKPGDPTKPPTTPPTKPPTKPTPAPVAALEQVGAKDLTATAGEDFGQIVRVRAKDTAGKPVAGVPVEFRIVGETGARFPDKADHVTVRTGADGTATAPRINAGDKAGSFTVRATAVGRKVPASEVGATVKAKPAPAPKADVLARTSDAKLTAKAGTAFAEGAVEVKATYQGKIAAGAAVTATMVTDDPKHPVENDKGPYFAGTEDKGAGKDADKNADKEKRARSLTLKTGADGLLKLPEIRTDQHAGTFLLRLTTADGAVLTVELTVTP